MLRIEKTVFISYRRTNTPWALAIYQNLTRHGYDVFFDYDSIPSGDFEQVILGNIRARAHFLVVLTPSALERCDNPDDWLRREIETALDEKRNIVPVFLEGFDFGSPSISKYLTGKLALLQKYNGQNVPAGFFDAAMEKIRSKFLNISLDAILHPISPTAQNKVEKQQEAASGAKPVEEKELTAQEWFERGNKYLYDKNFEESVYCYTKAIYLKPDYASAYNNRGVALKGNLDSAIKDYTEAIRLKQDYADAYYNRGNSQKEKGDLKEALKDYTEAIRLKQDNADFYNNRGIVRKIQADFGGAINDFTEAIRLKPNNADYYTMRGSLHILIGDFDGGMKDYNEAIRINPDFTDAYCHRGVIWDLKGRYDEAIADYQKGIDLGSKQEAVFTRLRYLRSLIK